MSFSRPEEIRLNRDADLRRLLAQPLEQRDRAVDVRRALHVEPEEVAGGFGALEQREAVIEADVGILVVAELRRLHRICASSPAAFTRSITFR